MRRTNGKKFVYVAGRYEYALGNGLLERLRVCILESRVAHIRTFYLTSWDE